MELSLDVVYTSPIAHEVALYKDDKLLLRISDCYIKMYDCFTHDEWDDITSAFAGKVLAESEQFTRADRNEPMYRLTVRARQKGAFLIQQVYEGDEWVDDDACYLLYIGRNCATRCSGFNSRLFPMENDTEYKATTYTFAKTKG